MNSTTDTIPYVYCLLWTTYYLYNVLLTPCFFHRNLSSRVTIFHELKKRTSDKNTYLQKKGTNISFTSLLYTTLNIFRSTLVYTPLSLFFNLLQMFFLCSIVLSVSANRASKWRIHILINLTSK